MMVLFLLCMCFSFGCIVLNSDQCSCGIEHLPFPLREQFLDAEGVEANSLFDELQNTLSTHQGEMAHFAGELRQVSSFTLPVESD